MNPACFVGVYQIGARLNLMFLIHLTVKHNDNHYQIYQKWNTSPSNQTCNKNDLREHKLKLSLPPKGSSSSEIFKWIVCQSLKL